MASLRIFQNEIDEIHTRETAKQRAQIIFDKEKEKENKNPQIKGKEAKDVGLESSKDEQVGLAEVEEEIQVNIRAACLSLCRTLKEY